MDSTCDSASQRNEQIGLSTVSSSRQSEILGHPEDVQYWQCLQHWGHHNDAGAWELAEGRCSVLPRDECNGEVVMCMCSGFHEDQHVPLPLGGVLQFFRGHLIGNHWVLVEFSTP